MSSVGLPARLGYAVVGFAAVGSAVFYAGMWLLPKIMNAAADDDDGYAVFRAAVALGVALGFTAGLVGLTLPWRRRRRRGRGRRIGVSACFVVVLSVAAASQEHRLVLDLMFAVWLAYSMALTYVRYGVFDARGRGAGDTQS